MNQKHRLKILKTSLEEGEILYRTCCLIWDYLKIDYVERDELISNTKNISEMMEKLCLDSNVYYRKVYLKKGWWRNNWGPFIGISDPGEKPVALIPKGGSFYQMIDLNAGQTQLVDDTLDLQLSLEAFVFYRPFPLKSPMKSKDIIEFSFLNKKSNLIYLLITGFLAAAILLFIPFGTQILFEYIIPYTLNALLIQLTIAFAAIALISSLFKFMMDSLIIRLAGIAEHDLQCSMWQKLFDLPLSFFNRYEVGDLFQRVSCFESLSSLLIDSNFRIMASSFFALIGIIPMFYYSPFLALVGILFSIPLICLGIFGFAVSYRKNGQISESSGRMNGLVLQFLYGLSRIRNQGAESRIYKLWEESYLSSKKVQAELATLLNAVKVAFNSQNEFSTLILFCAIFYILNTSKGFFWSSQPLSLSHFVAFMVAFGIFKNGLWGLCSTLLGFSEAAASWQRGSVIFDHPREFNSSKSETVELKGQIRMEHISFRYQMNSPIVLRNISISVNPGETIVIVGHTGSGKTTIAKLLLGFETPDSGVIYFDDIDLRTINKKQLRKQIGSVLHTSTLIDGSIRENVCGGQFYPDEDVYDILDRVGFMEDLKHMQMGLETILSTITLNISEGQKQKILIARALIKRPRILIFDEASSALDNQSQEWIYDFLDLSKLTRIIIAQRLSTITKADRICVLDKGIIVEDGKFQELIRKKGFLFNLMEKQMFEKDD